MSGPYWNEQWSVVTGCTSVSEGCEHCWAREMHQRFHPEPFSDVRERPERLDKPLHWRKAKTIFVSNTADLYHPKVSFEFIAAVYGVMAACPKQTFLICTKRPERRLEFMEWVNAKGIESQNGTMYAAMIEAMKVHVFTTPQKRAASSKALGMSGVPAVHWPLPNIWEGVTIENQARANERIPLLLRTPAAHRWVSAEPLLGPIDFSQILDSIRAAGLVMRNQQRIDQVIVGGESGSKARPCDVKWIRSIQDQCAATGDPCFVKQLGSNVHDTLNAIGGRHTPEPPSEYGRLHRRLRDRAGADPSEWPADLRVRELGWKI